MVSKAQASIERRVNEAMSAALKHHKYVSAVDVLVGMELLTTETVESWRKGQIPYLERVVIAGLGTISRAMRFFHQQSRKGGLLPRETAYLTRGSGKRPLRFSKSGNPNIEKLYRTHYNTKAIREQSAAKMAQRSTTASSGTNQNTATA